MSLRIAFLHPDLGIGVTVGRRVFCEFADPCPGGAERLVVDAALGLQALGHSVDLYTSHHDTNHCFEETKNGGSIQLTVSTFRLDPNSDRQVERASYRLSISQIIPRKIPYPVCTCTSAASYTVLAPPILA